MRRATFYSHVIMDLHKQFGFALLMLDFHRVIFRGKSYFPRSRKVHFWKTSFTCHVMFASCVRPSVLYVRELPSRGADAATISYTLQLCRMPSALGTSMDYPQSVQENKCLEISNLPKECPAITPKLVNYLKCVQVWCGQTKTLAVYLFEMYIYSCI